MKNHNNEVMHRFYRQARRDYKIGALASIEYARNRHALFAAGISWNIEHDENYDHKDMFGPMCLVIFDGDGTVLDQCGGIDETDENDPYIIQLAYDMASNSEEIAA